MRKDEEGTECPETLGEYRDMCAALGGPTCRAVVFLDKRISDQGRDEKVIISDSQMRVLLIPMLVPNSK